MRTILAAAALAATTALASCTSPQVIDASDKRAGADVKIEVIAPTGNGVGSGVYIGNGMILTAAHVLGGATTVKVKSDVGDVQQADVLWVNLAYDIAAIAPTNPGRFRAANLACREAGVGERIAAAGNPAGIEFVTMHGFVSGASRELAPKWKSAFLTDMTTIGGMSGGGIYDEAGRVVGITVGTLGFNVPSGGLGFAVPGSTVCKLLGRA